MRHRLHRSFLEKRSTGRKGCNGDNRNNMRMVARRERELISL